MQHRILLIEDDEVFSRMLVFLLEHHGFRVKVAGTLQEGRRQAEEFQPALLLLDVWLPDGNGLDLLETMRNDPAMKGLKVIGMSTEHSKALRERAQSLGVLEFWSKPLEINVVVRLKNDVFLRKN
ncbi:MAG: response regulator [Elusimicrobia bacterium]|nr:response regulator [Elusimicrobiota bacterium]